MVIKVQKIYAIERVTRGLQRAPLVGAKAFLRDRFMRKLREEFESVEKTRLELCEQYSDHDEAGEPIMTEEGEYQISTDRRDEFESHLSALLMSDIDVELPILPLSVFDEVEFSPGATSVIEEFIDETK